MEPPGRKVYGLLGKFPGRILSFDVQTARLWGSLVAFALGQGRVVPTVDSQLAATARLRSLTIVTRNEKHFKNLGVATLNPWL
jgi:predicted nucleic acid-binding protein